MAIRAYIMGKCSHNVGTDYPLAIHSRISPDIVQMSAKIAKGGKALSFYISVKRSKHSQQVQLLNQS